MLVKRGALCRAVAEGERNMDDKTWWEVFEKSAKKRKIQVKNCAC